MLYYHVDVFAEEPLTGNGLTVMVSDTFPAAAVMGRIAREMKQYETIFLRAIGGYEYEARIFTPEEELLFAGHPLLGGAAVLHAILTEKPRITVKFRLKEKDVFVVSDRLKSGKSYSCCMNQGAVKRIREIDRRNERELTEPFGIPADCLAEGLPLEVCTTGLPYLLIPIQSGIERTGVFSEDTETLLNRFDAKFAYVLDIRNLEGRTWDYRGLEDVATGSAVGLAADYLMRHGICHPSEEVTIQQGRFLDRPTCLSVRRDADGNMLVSGRVQIIGKGTFEGEG